MRYFFSTTDEREANLLFSAQKLYSMLEDLRTLRRNIYKYDALHHEWDSVRFTKWSHDNKSYLDSDDNVNAYHYAVSVVEDDIIKKLDDILDEIPLYLDEY
jgi:hypothetical protein